VRENGYTSTFVLVDVKYSYLLFVIGSILSNLCATAYVQYSPRMCPLPDDVDVYVSARAHSVHVVV